ncbi:MAG: DUF6298 domain-containing protein [Gemmataceae bacterium]
MWKPTPAATPTLHRLSLTDGRLTVDGRVLAGGRTGVQWWRGSLVPGRLGEFGLGVTRFVPGRTGRALTDDLDELTDRMTAAGQVALEHHYGLWYDRRRDDHQMIRRIDGEVWPPFYEQPWARSGTGTAWDGLSKYDLTKFNPWYFGRLKAFADLCDRKGLVLVHQMYFQHNILEAGALGSIARGGRPTACRRPGSQAAAVRGRQADLHGRRVLRRDAPRPPGTAPGLHPPLPRRLRRQRERDSPDLGRVHRAAALRREPGSTRSTPRGKPRRARSRSSA